MGTYAALAAVSLTLGYWVGVGWALPITRSTPHSSPTENGDTNDGKTPESDDEESEVSGGEELGTVQAGLLEECKLVGPHSGVHVEKDSHRAIFFDQSLIGTSSSY